MAEFHVIDSIAGLEELAADWDRLLNKCPTPNIFLSREWLLTWWNHFSQGGQLFVVVVIDNGEVIGIAPLILQRYKGLNTIRFIGSGRSDYLGLLAEQEIANDIICFLRKKTDWGVMDFCELAADDQLIRFAERFEGRNWEVYPGEICPYVKIDTDWSAYYRNQRNRKARYNLARSESRLQQMGRLRFERITEETDLDSSLAQMFALHRKRWKHHYTGTIFSNPQGQAFYREVAASFARRGWLSLELLFLDEGLVAASFSFFYRGVYSYFIPVYDPDYAAYSPGIILLRHLLEISFNRQDRVFDFMRGAEEYKMNWANAVKQNKRLVIGRSWSSYYSYRSLIRLKDWVRRKNTLRRVYGWLKRS